MPAVHRGRRIAVLKGIDDDPQRPALDTTAQLGDGRWLDAVDIVLDGLDLGEGRKARGLNALAVGDDGGRGKGVIEQTAVGMTRFDRPPAGGVEVAEARAASIDPSKRLGQ